MTEGSVLLALNCCVPNVLTIEELRQQNELYIIAALKAKYKNFRVWRFADPNTLLRKGIGKLYVYGVLNLKIFKSPRKHAICVDTDTGMFHDKFAPKQGLCVDVWFARKEKYLCDISTILRIEVSVAPENLLSWWRKRERKAAELLFLVAQDAHKRNFKKIKSV